MKDQGTIRDGTLEDAEAIASIYNESINAGIGTLDDEPKTADDIRKWLEGRSEREAILVLEKNQELIGWGILKKYSDRAGYRYTCETAVYLSHAYTGQGYGSQIKRALIERCKQYGYHHLVAKILSDNEVSIHYNRRFGYEIVGRQREVGFKNGGWRDVVIMQLLLDDVQPADLTSAHSV